MISYLELLQLIKEGHEPQLIKLKLNCGERYYQPVYDLGNFNYYSLTNDEDEDENFNYYLAETMLESQMIEKNIKILTDYNGVNAPDYIERLDLKVYRDIEERLKRDEQKINELISVMNEFKREKYE